MSTVAEQLRQAREQQKLSVYDVAESTKIKTDHVRALEEGNYAAFAAPIYIRGFVRAYAAVLHLNVPQVLSDLDEELSRSEHFRDAPGMPPRKRTVLDTFSLLAAKVNWRIALPILAVLLAVVLGTWAVRAWRQSRAVDPLESLGPGLYQPRQTQRGGTLPLPPTTPPRAP